MRLVIVVAIALLIMFMWRSRAHVPKGAQNQSQNVPFESRLRAMRNEKPRLYAYLIATVNDLDNIDLNNFDVQRLLGALVALGDTALFSSVNKRIVTEATLNQELEQLEDHLWANPEWAVNASPEIMRIIDGTWFRPIEAVNDVPEMFNYPAFIQHVLLKSDDNIELVKYLFDAHPDLAEEFYEYLNIVEDEQGFPISAEMSLDKNAAGNTRLLEWILLQEVHANPNLDIKDEVNSLLNNILSDAELASEDRVADTVKMLMSYAVPSEYMLREYTRWLSDAPQNDQIRQLLAFIQSKRQNF